jgi:hypothetical protein
VSRMRQVKPDLVSAPCPRRALHQRCAPIKQQPSVTMGVETVSGGGLSHLRKRSVDCAM